MSIASRAFLSPSTFLSILSVVLLTACSTPSGADPGAPCVLASECASRFCVRGSTGATTCAARCSASVPCGSGSVCGRVDFRQPDTDDAGNPVAANGNDDSADTEVVHLCRAPLNIACDGDNGCRDHRPCIGQPGHAWCSMACATDTQCGAGTKCIVTTCGMPGHCALPCDAIDECPSGEYCDLTSTDTSGHGRCAARATDSNDLVEAGACGDASGE